MGGWPKTFWPGAVCNDWFGVFAFYTSCLALLAMIVLLVVVFAYIVCNWNDPTKW